MNNSRNSKKFTNESTNNANNSSSVGSQQNLGLASISYADYVILSSTLSFAIAEELNGSDLDMLIVFFGMVTSDLALLRTKRGITNAQSNVEEGIIGAEESTEGPESIASVSSSLRGRSRKRCKRIKKVKKKRKSSTEDSLNNK